MPYVDPQRQREYLARYKKNNHDRALKASRDWYAKYPMAVWICQLKKKYGISLDEYAEMEEEQTWACAICERAPKPGKRLGVDHDHRTGKIRGLLCQRCNISVGYIEKDKTLYDKSLAYIERNR